MKRKTSEWRSIGGFFGALFEFFFLRSNGFARYFGDANLVR
ncbi:MAG: hypothetical protein ACC700_19830 [Anaerolineales bacterium]